MKNIVIVGRPNTGKSTLFNALTNSRDALVHDRPGVTRDTISGKIPGRAWTLYDTAGLENAKSGIAQNSTDMAIKTIENADAILFVVDGRVGLNPMDIEWAKLVHRKTHAPALLLVNKSESGKRMADVHDFYKLGFGEPLLISAEHKRGFDVIYEFMDKIGENEDIESETEDKTIKVAVLGQPNVGKSTFVNRVLGENRQIVMDAPGITRDTVKIPTRFYGRDIVIMDTAGLRRKAGVTDDVETLSALKSLDAIEKSDIVWDLVDESERDEKLLKLKHQFTNSFHQIIKPLILAISAEKGTGVQNLFKRIYEQWDISNTDAPTSLINRIVEKLVAERQPPMSRLKRPMKIKFARQTGHHPIKITINVGGASDIPESYTRYLRRGIATALKMEHLPIIIEYQKSENPFD